MEETISSGSTASHDPDEKQTGTIPGASLCKSFESTPQLQKWTHKNQTRD
jgi:nickel-dependent lactate racemase